MSRKRVVVLSGAGISAESGLKTFRDSDGLWEGHRVEDVATPFAWSKDPQLVLDFYNQRRRDIAGAQPNAAHLGLAELERDFEVRIITQNVDDLHERARSSHVLHLHGEIFRRCSERDRGFAGDIREDMLLGDRAPDGCRYRPDIVWFGEPVPLLETAAKLVAEADVLVVIGTSLQVYPAAGLVHLAPRNAQLFVIDRKIPEIRGTGKLTVIEKSATAGIADLRSALHTFLAGV